MNKKSLVLLASLLALMGVSCAGESQNVSIQDIITQWARIERFSAQPEQACIATLDEFYESLRSFAASELYLSGVLVPFPHDRELDGFSGIYALGDLVSPFRTAVLGGDREKALLLSPYISSILIHAAAEDGREQRFALAMHFRLLSVLALIIALAGCAIQFMHRTLDISLSREKESSSLSRAVLLSQEVERRRISRDLHDTVVQDIRHISGEIDRIIEIQDTGQRKQLYTEISQKQSAIAGRLRDICANLAPPDFAFQSLPDALRQLCADFGERSGISCRLEIAEEAAGQRPGLDFLGREKLVQVFRIVQEALTNAEKHSAAKKVVVALRLEDDGSFSVVVSDDGGGVKAAVPESTPGARALGIRGMNERAALLGGSLTISNVQNGGTVVHLRIPSPAQKDRAAATTGILLVDDHSLSRSAFTALLERSEGFEKAELYVAAQAGTLGEARRFLEETEKLPSLIILDIQLIGENGLDFIPILKDFCAARGIQPPPVLVCSAFDDDFRVQLALKQGALGYVPKTARAEEFLKAIDTVLRGEVYTPQGYAQTADGDSEKLTPLSLRELEVLNLLKQGKTPLEITGLMSISIRTVRNHITHIYDKVGVNTRAELMKK